MIDPEGRTVSREDTERFVDFDPVSAKVTVRPTEFTLHWSNPSGAFSLDYASGDNAMAAFDVLRRSASVTHASLYRGDRCFEVFDYDPYAWHDVRTLVGR